MGIASCLEARYAGTCFHGEDPSPEAAGGFDAVGSCGTAPAAPGGLEVEAPPHLPRGKALGGEGHGSIKERLLADFNHYPRDLQITGRSNAHKVEKGSETEPLGGRIRPTWHRLVDTTQRPARFHRFAFTQGRAGTGSRFLALLLFMPFPFRFQARVILLMTAHGFYIFESYVELYYYGCWFSVYLLYLLGGYCWYLENNE